MTKYEYEVLKLPNNADEIKRIINDLGQKSWDLIRVVVVDRNVQIAYLKREIVQLPGNGHQTITI